MDLAEAVPRTAPEARVLPMRAAEQEPLPSTTLSARSEHARLFYTFLEPLEPAFRDPEVEEIMVNAPDQIFIEKRGVMFQLPDIRLRPEAIRGAINVASYLANSSVGIGVNESPLVHAQVDNLRIAGAIQPIANYSDCLCIRVHRRKRLSLQDYEGDGSFAHLLNKWERPLPKPPGADIAAVGPFFRALMQQGATIVVSGTPGGGKSTFVDALVAEIPRQKRVVLIEDTHEIDPKVPNRLCLIANEEAKVSIRHLVKFSQRCRPDWLIIGELRGAEAADFLNAANSGPKSLASVHADSALDALGKLEDLTLQAHEGMQQQALRAKIARCVQIVVHFARSGTGRVPVEAIRVTGYRNGEYQVEDIFAGAQ